MPAYSRLYPVSVRTVVLMRILILFKAILWRAGEEVTFGPFFFISPFKKGGSYVCR